HSLANRGIDLTTLQTYDLSISTYLVSMGQSKQDLAGVLSWYKLEDSSSPASSVHLLPDILSAEAEKLANIPRLADLIDLEQSLAKVVVQMERNGIRLDAKLAGKYTDELEKGLAALEKSIYADVGHEFNISSPKQVGEVLFVEKSLPSGKKTKSGSYSTDERILKGLVAADPVVEKILDYRELAKLLSTYLRPLPRSVNAGTGRVHGEFNQLGAVTGRFSSKNPNLQNIPLGEIAGVNMRDAFVCDPGHVLLAFDYSQQELRFLAELSGEENMQQAFQQNQDIHARTAAEIFEIPLAEVTGEQRKVGKTVNFGVVYGISAYGLSDRLKIDPRKAADFIDKYFARYPKVK
ncbi:DNA polymerase I, partial [Candidatus Dojkabacteria bacterium]|nr:DNA polymerase I [Candidatus Dojkabacteria bacterium]